MCVDALCYSNRVFRINVLRWCNARLLFIFSCHNADLTVPLCRVRFLESLNSVVIVLVLICFNGSNNFIAVESPQRWSRMIKYCLSSENKSLCLWSHPRLIRCMELDLMNREVKVYTLVKSVIKCICFIGHRV